MTTFLHRKQLVGIIAITTILIRKVLGIYLRALVNLQSKQHFKLTRITLCLFAG
jgi:hypothetical protein